VGVGDRAERARVDGRVTEWVVILSPVAAGTQQRTAPPLRRLRWPAQNRSKVSALVRASHCTTN